MKRRIYPLAVCALVMALAFFASCAKEAPENAETAPVNETVIIETADGLAAFFESGEKDRASVVCQIDMGDRMLKLTSERGGITLDCSGYEITGNGDCVIRMGEGATLTLNEARIVADAIGIGCLGTAELGGVFEIESTGSSIASRGLITVSDSSYIRLTSGEGTGLECSGLVIGKYADVHAKGYAGAVNASDDDGVILYERATLSAETESNYFAMKTPGILEMRSGSTLSVENGGDYHGAEIGALTLDGVARIEAKGGEKGVGLFIMELEEDCACLGHCAPEARTEAGDGTLTFYMSESELEAAEADSSTKEVD